MILVTGATGRVGAAVHALLEPAAARAASRTREGEGWVRFDFADPATFDEALRGVSTVFLMRPPQMARVRRDMTPFFEAMDRAGVERVVSLSVMGADKATFLPHHAMDEMVRGSGLKWTIVQPADFMQNFTSVFADDVRAGELVLPAGKGRSAYVDVEDVAAVAAAALRGGHEGETIVATGPESLSGHEVAGVLAEVLGRPVRYRAVSPLTFLARESRRRGAGMAAVMTGIYSAQRLGFADRVTGDVERVLGRPPHPWREVARRLRTAF